jgi:hypothetical protein
MEFSYLFEENISPVILVYQKDVLLHPNCRKKADKKKSKDL